ncbi:MAG: hypothetical protein HYX66_01085 [Ignavibacteria bacterium]|nr:hypothetical protein [Ignavibacteria bacterium]
MAAVWIFLLSVATFFVTIALIVVAQETHPLVSILIAGVVAFGAIKLFQARITRI